MADHIKSPSAASQRILERAYTLKTPDEAKALYRDWAISYDQHLEQGLHYIAPACIAQILANVLADCTASILDIGCGTAAYARLLSTRANASPPVTVDLSGKSLPNMIAWPEKLPFTADSFDCVTALHFVRRFEDDVVEAFASELARILAPGGAALVVEFGPVKSRKLNLLHKHLLSCLLYTSPSPRDRG